MNLKFFTKFLTIFLLIAFIISGHNLKLQAESAKTSKKQEIFSLENEFIKIMVNNEIYDTGRFAIATTGGNPSELKDNNKQLIYGLPKPWTSYTTVRIDGKDYIFGGPTKKRAGKNGLYGNLLSQEINTNTIISKYQLNNIIITQTISFFRNPVTRVKDTAKISYSLQNTGSQIHNIGIRIMMDTMLGSNDGAPFRIGTKAIESELSFSKREILDYWQAFDNLATPNIIAQGTLNLPESAIEPPDKMFLVNWGTLADNPWDFTYVESRSFIRSGETEKDTALALYWENKELRPDSELNFQTLYGLGDVSLSPGELSIGVTAPAEIYATSKNEFLLIGYILNSGGFNSNNTIASFEIPKDFKIISGAAKINLGVIKSGKTCQVALKCKINRPIPGIKTIKFAVTSDTLEANSIKRQIEILAPPKLKIDMKLPDLSPSRLNPYFDILLNIENTEDFPISEIKTTLAENSALKLPWFETKTKNIKVLLPGEATKLTWKVKAINLDARLAVSARLQSKLTKPQSIERFFQLEDVPSQLKLTFSKKSLRAGDYFFLKLAVINNTPAAKYSIQISYNPDLTAYLSSSPAKHPVKVNSNQIHYNFTTSNLKLSEEGEQLFHFKAIKAGLGEFVFRYKDKIEVLPFSIEPMEAIKNENN